MFKIVDGPIDELALESAVRTDADGAVIVSLYGTLGVARTMSAPNLRFIFSQAIST